MFYFSAVDMTYGTVYCFDCGDYVYDSEFEVMARQQSSKSAKSLGKLVGGMVT